jgi:hypothetical protein
MTDYDVPTLADYKDADNALALGQVSAEAIPLMDRLAASLFTGYEVARYEGSFSIKEGGQTIAKLIPRGDGVFVGIRDSKTPERWFSGPLKTVSVNGVDFRGVVVPVESREQSDAEKLILGITEK